LRRATTIESGLFKIQAKQLPRFRQRRRDHLQRHKIIDSLYPDVVGQQANDPSGYLDTDSRSTDQSNGITRSFLRLTNLPTYPLDRLSRYEAMLWRQTCQILFTLNCFDRRKPWERPRIR
jgi:hypothetical protein